jgi:hypothetical protein
MSDGTNGQNQNGPSLDLPMASCMSDGTQTGPMGKTKTGSVGT